MNEYHAKIEKIYSELVMTHIYNTEGINELKKTIIEKNITHVDELLPLIFDYAFKCGLRRALQIIQGQEDG